MESSKGKHLQKEELWIRLERVMMARQEDVRTEDTVRWDDTKARRCRLGMSVRRIPYRDLFLA